MTISYNVFSFFCHVKFIIFIFLIGMGLNIIEADAHSWPLKHAGKFRPVFDFLQCYLIEQLRLKDGVQVGWK
jgi:hypothetical protein